MNDTNLPYSLQECVILLAAKLNEKDIWYQGDMADFGNEVGYALGQVIQNMKETDITDFVHGLHHGISLTNDTH